MEEPLENSVPIPLAMRHQALDNGPNKLTDQTKQVASFKKVNVRKPWLIGMIATEWDGEDNAHR